WRAIQSGGADAAKEVATTYRRNYKFDQRKAAGDDHATDEEHLDWTPGQEIRAPETKEMIASKELRILATALGIAATVALAQANPTLLQRTVEMISSPNVAADMKLTDGQVSQRNKLFAAYEASRSEIVRRMQAGPPSELDARNAELGRAGLDLDQKLL